MLAKNSFSGKDLLGVRDWDCDVCLAWKSVTIGQVLDVAAGLNLSSTFHEYIISMSVSLNFDYSIGCKLQWYKYNWKKY